MGKIRNQGPVKLIIGFIFQKEDILDKTLGILEKRFGKIDFQSPPLAFTYTDYYEPEFGKNLTKIFVSFKKLISPQHLPNIKTATNLIEIKLSVKGSRLINIDPGYLDMAKLILASTKNYNHRIFVGKGIYAEITLSYKNNTFTPWEWTYQDYKSAEYIAIFNRIRQIYAEQIENN